MREATQGLMWLGTFWSSSRCQPRSRQRPEVQRQTARRRPELVSARASPFGSRGSCSPGMRSTGLSPGYHQPCINRLSVQPGHMPRGDIVALPVPVEGGSVAQMASKSVSASRLGSRYREEAPTDTTRQALLEHVDDACVGDHGVDSRRRGARRLADQTVEGRIHRTVEIAQLLERLPHKGARDKGITDRRAIP